MKPHIRAEIWIVLGLSLGQSAVYAVVSLTAKYARGPIRDSTATLNPSRSDLPWLDLTYQLLAIGFALVPVFLALYLLARDRDAPPITERLGFDARHPLRDLGLGALLAAIIGIPGLGVYALGRELGLTADIILAPEKVHFWTWLVLVLAAIQNALLEEVVAVGYLMTRLADSGWSVASMILASALLRGSYHLYQGIGQGVGNVIMGIVFGWWYHRTKRLMPLIVAHALIDIVAFVGYALFAETLGLR